MSRNASFWQVGPLGCCSFQNILTNPIISQINTLLLPYLFLTIPRRLQLISSTTMTPKCTLRSVLFTYGLTAWGQAYKLHLEKPLKLQKRALRFIYFSERNQHAIPLFIDAGVLPLKFLYYEHLANLMFEIRHNNAPGNIQDLFQDISDIHSYNTRSSASNNFYTQVPDSQFKCIHFLDSEKYGMKCLYR